jgi:hypothetical protein
MIEHSIVELDINGLRQYFNADKYHEGVNVQEHLKITHSTRFAVYKILYWCANYTI